jgi:hypothetical protein
MALNLYSSSTTDTLLAAKLDLAGGTMTGALTLSASGIIFSDATYLTTAPAGSALAADQLTAGVVTANPSAGPTAVGDVLKYDGSALVWGPGGGGGSAVWGGITGVVTDQTDLTAYLASNYYPLSSNPAGYITEAPIDGFPYVRKNGAWDINSAPVGSVNWGYIAGYITDQLDLISYLSSNYYGISNPSGFQTASDVSTYVSGLGYVADAPSDGTTYGRKDATWTAIPTAPTLLKTKVNMYASSASWDGTYLRVYLGPNDIANNFSSASRWFATVYGSVMYAVLSVSYQTDSSGRPYAQISCNGAGGAIDSNSPLYYTEDGGTTWTVADLPIF